MNLLVKIVGRSYIFGCGSSFPFRAAQRPLMQLMVVGSELVVSGC
jgi:hypothetical protein